MSVVNTIIKWLFMAGCLIVILYGCQGVEYTAETGYIDSKALGQPKNGKHIEAAHYGAHAERELYRLDDFNVRSGLGVIFIAPVDGKGDAGGLDWIARLQYDLGPVEPYLVGAAGAIYMPELWDPQPTHFGFTLQAGAGIRWELDEAQSVMLEYRYWHESNGSKLFGSARPNPGFDSSAIFIGYGYKF